MSTQFCGIYRIEHNDMYALDEGVVGSGMGFSCLWATGGRFGRKTQKGPAKFVYCIHVLPPPPQWKLCWIGWQFPSVADNK